MEVTEKQLKQINLITREIDDFLSDYSMISKDYKVVDGYDDNSVRVEFTFKSKFGEGEVTFYFEVYDDRYEFEIGEDICEPLTETNFWKQLVFELWK